MKKYIILLALISQLGVLYAVPADWTVNSANYQYSITITGTITINGQVAGQAGDAMAVFIDDECRGVAEASFIEANNQYYFFLTVFSNTYSGENITFSFYNQLEDSIYSGFTQLIFTDGDNYGTVSQPYVLNNVVVTDIKNSTQALNLHCYPNPAINTLTVASFNELSHILIYNVNGQLISVTNVFHDSTIDVSHLNNGTYLIEAIGSQTKQYGKFIKE